MQDIGKIEWKISLQMITEIKRRSGGSNDKVYIEFAAWSKVAGALVSDGANNYEVWNHNSAAAQLLIQQNVQVI